MSESLGKDNPAFSNEDEKNDRPMKNGTQEKEPKADTANSVTENGHRPAYKTETRIELPPENNEKSPVPAAKVNGVHAHNGNNNDTSFLNSSSVSAQSNGTRVSKRLALFRRIFRFRCRSCRERAQKLKNVNEWGFFRDFFLAWHEMQIWEKLYEFF